MPITEVGAPDLSRSGQERPLVSMEGWARFEQRARQRRIEHRLQAARAAVRSRQWTAARDALDELKELDPNLPELAALTDQIARAEARGPHTHRGAFAVAAAAFVVVLLTASWITNIERPASEPVATTAPSAAVPEALLASRDVAPQLRDLARDLPVATAGSPITEMVLPDTEPFDPPAVPVPPAPLATPLPAAALPAPSSVSLPPPPVEIAPAPAPEPVDIPPPAPAVRAPEAAAPLAATASANSAPPAAVVPAAVPPAAAVVDDGAQVRALLKRYQAAYASLDAGLVQEVWPGVNEAALARAFEGLESQTLTFNRCDVQLRGTTASVACTGTTRYIPKIGSRAPRVEPLAWNFTLRKRADDWEIETARAER